MPVGPSASRLAIQSDTLSFGPKHPNPISLRSSDVPPGSSIIPNYLDAERSEYFAINAAEQEDAHASFHWTRGDNLARADVEGRCAYQRASRLYQGAEACEG
jgi:hypothetical protein